MWFAFCCIFPKERYTDDITVLYLFKKCFYIPVFKCNYYQLVIVT